MVFFKKSQSKVIFSVRFAFLAALICFSGLVWSSDHSGWNDSRRYMAHGICDSNQKDMCDGKGFCDDGGAVTKCTGCGEEPGGWYQYTYYCEAPPSDVCTGNSIAKNYNYPNQSCEVYCIGWGVHHCFVLDGEFKACTLGTDHGYCMCGEIIGSSPGCVPIPPTDPD